MYMETHGDFFVSTLVFEGVLVSDPLMIGNGKVLNESTLRQSHCHHLTTQSMIITKHDLNSGNTREVDCGCPQFIC